ncbi:unannotated protein [freshwater metagenome]|uniref:Unannotated protein n=1 Tax=freshwater metagenome TaxID=449393 RepID=A0A6J6CX51_9ZZZZ
MVAVALNNAAFAGDANPEIKIAEAITAPTADRKKRESSPTFLIFLMR